MSFFIVKARRPIYSHEPETPRRWIQIGVATEQEDGNVLIRINALPLNFDGELKLEVYTTGSKKPD